MSSIFDKSLKGVFTPHRKNTHESATVTMPVPDEVYIVMSQHMGPPCNVLVKPGDDVLVGQIIGDSDALLSAPIHSSVSGKVTRIDEIIMPNGTRSRAVVVAADKKQEMCPDIKPPTIKSRGDFLKAIRDSGVVGLGGAGFPTHVKFNPDNLEEIDTLIINAAECEPYITSDYRTIMEDSALVLEGIKSVMKNLDISNCKIGVEDNNPEAIRLLSEEVKGVKGVEVVKLRSKYPQGAEKVIIYETIGRVVPEGKLPGDIGALVINVTTAAQIGKFLMDGIPLVSKRVTVDGDAVKNPANVMVPIGTPLKCILDFCGGPLGEVRKVLWGGPMMGSAVYDMNYPVLKNTNAVLFFAAGQVEDYDESACIRCGRCVKSCPMNLMPLRIEDSFNRGDMDGLKRYKVNLCMECGCCAYSCPAKRHLVQVHRLAKVRLRSAGK